jgi:pimeloyl-ACP methyl ester carboxylesterase
VGNDTGGGICQLVVAHAPDRVGRLVLTNCDAYDAFPPLLLRPLCALARRRPRALDILLRGLRTRAGRTLLAFPSSPAATRSCCGRGWPPWRPTPRPGASSWTCWQGSSPGTIATRCPGSAPSGDPCCWRGHRATRCSRSASRAAWRTDLPQARLVLLARGRGVHAARPARAAGRGDRRLRLGTGAGRRRARTTARSARRAGGREEGGGQVWTRGGQAVAGVGVPRDGSASPRPACTSSRAR